MVPIDEEVCHLLHRSEGAKKASIIELFIYFSTWMDKLEELSVSIHSR